MNILKHWKLNLLLSFIFLGTGILFLFPDLSIYIISIFTGLFILLYYIYNVVPKYRKLRNVNSEWIMWVVIESIVLICSSLLSFLTPKIIIDLYIFKFNLSNIFGLILVLESLVGIIKLCNLIYIKNLNYRPKKYLKYIYLLILLIGTYILFNTSIDNLYLSYILSGFCFILFFINFILFFRNKKISKLKNNNLIESK